MEVTIARIPYLDPASAPAPVADALAALPGPLNVFAMVANAQSAFRPWLRLGAALLTELQLDPVLRELAILEVARLSRCEYEHVQHRVIALGVGASEEQVGAVEAGEGERLDHRARAVVLFTREVVGDVRAGEETLQGVQAFLSPREVVELLLVVGHYMAIARLAETTGIELDDPADMAVVESARRRGELT